MSKLTQVLRSPQLSLSMDLSHEQGQHSALLFLITSLARGDKGQTLKASYIHVIGPINSSAVAAEMIHRFSTYENSFTIGASHAIDPLTMVKARFNHSGKVAMLCQHEWRPKSVVTLSAEFDPKAVEGPSKFGLALSLKP